MTLHESLDPAICAPSPTSFHDLMAGVGYLLFQWSTMERSLEEEILLLRRAGGDVATQQLRARSVNERLGEWRALLSRGRRRNPDQLATIDRLGERIQDFHRMRNLVANGMADAAFAEDEPVIRCTLVPGRHGAPDELHLSLRDLLSTIAAMETARSEMAALRDHGLY